MNKLQHVKHGFGPLYDENSEVLILGSFPSPKSREINFYYGHPQNRFWKVMAQVLESEVPNTIEEKRKMMLDNHIALWDVIEECDICGASDASIDNVIPTDTVSILNKTKIKDIYCLGKISYRYYQKYSYPITNIKAILLPSTSPANCAKKLDDLIQEFKVIKKQI